MAPKQNPSASLKSVEQTLLATSGNDRVVEANLEYVFLVCVVHSLCITDRLFPGCCAMVGIPTVWSSASRSNGKLTKPSSALGIATFARSSLVASKKELKVRSCLMTTNLSPSSVYCPTSILTDIPLGTVPS